MIISLTQKYNNENILSRAVIAGILNILNNYITYDQVWGNEPEDIEEVKIPWFYNQSGDERFMQDFYTHYAECVPPRPADGNFDMIPRGVITYNGSQIDTNRITSRYLQGKYLKEKDGKLESYVSFLFSIPLTLNFEMELWVDTQITALKIEQAINEEFYKNVTFFVYYKGMRVGCTAGFPESYTTTKNVQYSFESDNRIKMTFSLSVETYQPVFDKTTEVKASSNIKKFTYTLHSNEQKNMGTIKPITPKENTIISKGQPLYIEWNFTEEEGILRDVDLYWSYEGSNEYNTIITTLPNHEYFIWNIPEDFTKFKDPEIIWEETEYIWISRKPLINIIPDLENGQITENSFKIIDPGYFVARDNQEQINIQLEMRDKDNKIVYTKPGDLLGIISNNVLEKIVLKPGINIIYPNKIDYKKINIHITNSADTNTQGIIKNLVIL